VYQPGKRTGISKNIKFNTPFDINFDNIDSELEKINKNSKIIKAKTQNK